MRDRVTILMEIVRALQDDLRAAQKERDTACSLLKRLIGLANYAAEEDPDPNILERQGRILVEDAKNFTQHHNHEQ